MVYLQIIKLPRWLGNKMASLLIRVATRISLDLPSFFFGGLRAGLTNLLIRVCPPVFRPVPV